MSTIKDKNLATIGQQEVDWAARQMKVLEEIKTEFSSSKPLNGLNITLRIRFLGGVSPTPNTSFIISCSTLLLIKKGSKVLASSFLML